MPVRLNSSGGGSVTLDVPSTGSAFTMTLPAANGNLGINLGTAQASTSGTAIDFTGIPAGVRRVTVLFNNVSTNGTSRLLVRLGTSGGIVSSGYTASGNAVGSANNTAGSSDTTGFNMHQNNAVDVASGVMFITRFSGNTWISSHTMRFSTGISGLGAGDVVLGAECDRLRITTVNGTDVFDGGSINIAWEF